jgi:pentose-5-phosphate-3-epimerase
MRIEDAPIKLMRWDRGKALRLVDEADGAKKVDVHINLINVDSGPGPTHYHAKAENIYVVLEGSVEAIVCLLTIRDGVLPPTINLDNPDPECDLDYIPRLARDQDVSVALSNSFGFGGQNITLILRRFTD